MLPKGPGWTCELYELEGNKLDNQNQPRRETIELWKRDPVWCIKELIGNLAFREKMRYVPERVYENKEGMSWVYDEMWTGD